MRSLEKYLDQIYTDFENDVKRMDCLCEIASLNYRTPRLPDYHNIHVQRLECGCQNKRVRCEISAVMWEADGGR